MEDVKKEIIRVTDGLDWSALYYNPDELAKNDLLENARQEGIEQGIMQGITQGIEQGSNDKMQEIIKNMIALKFSKENIINATGISQEKLDELLKEAN